MITSRKLGRGTKFDKIIQMLLGDDETDWKIAYEILTEGKYEVEFANRRLFEAGSDVQLFNPKAAGLVHTSNNKYVAAIAWKGEDGCTKYKYIER